MYDCETCIKSSDRQGSCNNYAISNCLSYERDPRGKLVQGNVTLDISSYHYGYEYKTGFLKYGQWIDLKYGLAKVIKINSIDLDNHKINMICEYFENELHAHNEKCKKENEAMKLRKTFKVITNKKEN